MLWMSTVVQPHCVSFPWCSFVSLCLSEVVVHFIFCTVTGVWISAMYHCCSFYMTMKIPQSLPLSLLLSIYLFAFSLTYRHTHTHRYRHMHNLYSKKFYTSTHIYQHNRRCRRPYIHTETNTHTHTVTHKHTHTTDNITPSEPLFSPPLDERTVQTHSHTHTAFVLWG